MKEDKEINIKIRINKSGKFAFAVERVGYGADVDSLTEVVELLGYLDIIKQHERNKVEKLSSTTFTEE